jgi:hypothetical protein
MMNRPTRFAANGLLGSSVDPSGRGPPVPTPPGGNKVTVALALAAGEATLVAVTVTVWAEAIDAGAAYSPALLMLPVPDGLMDQVTAVLLAFVTVAVNCWVCEAVKVALVGATLTVTGLPAAGDSVTVALADAVPSALVAVTVTV